MLSVLPEVADALASGAPVVALESTIISHGLPRPENLRVAREIEQAVRRGGAVPATVAVVDGHPCIGLDDAALEQVANRDDVVKVSTRDLATLVARKGMGATTVAATSHLAALAGIGVFATGGLGGVHRDARSTWDESADLQGLASTDITIVCAGVKSILDVGATLERLETLGVGIVGYRTNRFPGFFISDSGYPLDWSADSPQQVADMLRAQREQGVHRGALIVANPLPPDEQLDPELHDEVLLTGLSKLDTEQIVGKAVTPFLLSHFHSATQGLSLAVNVRLILRNAALAAQIAARTVS